MTRNPRKRVSAAGYKVPDHKWSHEPNWWLETSKCYHPELWVCLLAQQAIADDKAKDGQSGQSSMGDDAKVRQQARRSMQAYRDGLQSLPNGQTTALPCHDLESAAKAASEFRDAVTKEVQRYLVGIEREKNAPPLNDTHRWVEGLGKAAAGVVKAYDAQLSGNARSLARADIERLMREGTAQLEDKMPPDLMLPASDMRPLVRLGEIVDACRRLSWFARQVADDIRNDDTIQDGSAWGKFVRNMYGLCQKRDMPVGVSNKLLVGGEVSPFIQLIETITLTTGTPRHCGTADALASAIQRALTAVK